MPRTARALVLLLLLLMGMTRALAQQTPAAQRAAQNDLATDLAALMVPADRSTGSAGAAQAADYLAARLAAVPGATVFRQPFVLAVPVVERCDALLLNAEGIPLAPLPIAPVLPSGLQLASITDAPLPLLYAGRATPQELAGHVVANHVVALDIDSSPTAWQTVASLGARAVIFLGDSQTPNVQFLEKETTVPVGLPRFYCDDPSAVDMLRSQNAAGPAAVRIRLRARWQERRLENLLCLIPGSQQGPGPDRNPQWSHDLLVLQARYDAPSQVLGRAPGATQAANAAAAIALANAIAQTPEHATVLVALTAGDEWNLQGTRTLLEMLGRAPNAARQTAILTESLAAAEARLADAQVLARGLEKAAAGSLDAALAPPIKQTIADELLRESSHAEDALEQARLAAVPAPPRPSVIALERQKSELLQASAALAGRRDIGAPEKKRIVAAAQTQLPVRTEDLARLTMRRDALRAWPDIHIAIGPRTPLMLFSLQLTTGANTFGFFTRSDYARALDASGELAGFAQAFRRYAPAAPGFLADSLENRFTLETFFPLPRAFSSDAALMYAVPAGALATTGDPAPFLDTPNDTAAHLNEASLESQLHGITALFLGANGRPGIATDPYFYARADLPLYTGDQPLTVFEKALGETLPQLPAADTVVAAQCLKDGRPLGPPLAGTRRLDVAITLADGTAVFPLALRIPDTRDVLSAFTFDDRGNPTRTLVAADNETTGLATDFYPSPDHPLNCMLFDCQRLDAFSLFDPRSFALLTDIDLLDARRTDRAAYANIAVVQDADLTGWTGDAGLAAVFFPPDMRWQLLAGRGTQGNRLVVINADPQHPSGEGFTTTDTATLGPLPWRGAQDLFALDARRKTDLEKFGISNEVIRDLQTASAQQLALAKSAQARRDTPAFFAATDALWSLQQQVYDHLIATSNGIIRGVIFLLLGIIPFSYFLERLVVGATNVYRQIAWFALIFCLMTAALWFHPAFRISAAPMMIILAFFILILSSTVVYILWGKFDEEIRRLRYASLRGPGTAGGAAAPPLGQAGHITSLQRGAVLGAAMRLGLSNMRRRGTRTALTLVTLVLLTFTLLCFTSVRESLLVSPARVALSVPTPPPGILIRQRSWRQLPDQTLDLAAGLALPATVTLPVPATQPSPSTQPASPGPLAARWWYASQRPEDSWSLPIKNPRTGETTYVSAFLGLDRDEAAFHAARIDTILPRFTSAADDACWLPAPVQSALHLSPGDTLLLAGRPLTVAGFFTDDTLGQLRQLTDDPLTPIDPAGSATIQGANASNEDTNRPEIRPRFYPPSSVAVIRAPLARALGARLTSIIFRPANLASPQQLDAVAEAFAQRADITVYASDGNGVHAINASAAARPQDFSTVLVPMLIAGVIVLNTMLGAVAERTREIHVYTSVGLAPSHVGMLFLAEAAALGTLGVVFGYIFGQGLATILSGTHLLPGVDLNYSSLSAIVTMGAVLALVMLSALWPARAASRVAAPSLTREWRLPPAVGDILDVELPFTVNETAARGVCAFLAEYLATASQTGAGRFTADELRPFATADAFAPDAARATVRGLSARVWLAPYDLGVIQNVRVAIHPPRQPSVFEVRVRLTREAGNPATWHRLNRPFLTDIRKQFLLWRTLPPEAVQRYVDASDRFFHAAPRQEPPADAKP